MTRVLVEKDDGSTVDVTQGVSVMYDAIVCSLDWRSGFLDAEEECRIALVALHAGFELPDVVTERSDWKRERVTHLARLTPAEAEEILLRTLAKYDMTDPDNP